MTEEFIQKHCANCDRCIWERYAFDKFYPYPPPPESEPKYCGTIDKGGCVSIELEELEECYYGKK